MERWLTRLQLKDHRNPIWYNEHHTMHLSSDASQAVCGVFQYGCCHWFYRNWLLDSPAIVNVHINPKKLKAVEEAIRMYGSLNKGNHTIVHTDNMSAAWWVNTWTIRSGLATAMLKNIANLACQHDHAISCQYIQGHCNNVADAMSCLHSIGQLHRLRFLLHSFHLPQGGHPSYHLLNHMSPLSALFLSPQVAKLQEGWLSWIDKLQACEHTHLPHPPNKDINQN